MAADTPEATRLNSIDDLLTEQERQELYADLAEIARLRRRAEAEARNIVLGGH